MINGSSPVMIFNFNTKRTVESLFGVFNTENTIVAKATANAARLQMPIPIPVPFINSGDLTNYRPSTTMTTRSENVGDIVFQRAMGIEISKKIKVKNDSTFLQMFLPLIMKACELIKGDAYSVSFFEDSTIIFDGKISGMSSTPDSEDNTLTVVEFTIVDSGSINNKDKALTDSGAPKAWGTEQDINIPGE